MMILGHRNSRTRGRESNSRSAMEEHYDGADLFANDGECWGCNHPPPDRTNQRQPANSLRPSETSHAPRVAEHLHL